ncbi:hypothetical protein [Psychroflexus maritimus]|uniref:Uncharacterized protein n=1 Tax=Psychroflexus maritimus TaxID=2714865 RepID=A0A967E6Y1_9FLAO|nr:hypothetical protein [Psychroflexus maritimus]NGZ90201.1 hypothetical protein [Psychroflexus maritimus]
MKLTSILFFLCIAYTSIGQNNSKLDIGIIPKINGENLLLIDANKGSIVSFTSVGEEIFAATVSESEEHFYFLSRNKVYKGLVSSGELIREFKYHDLQKESIKPLAISMQGIAIYKKIENRKEKKATGSFGAFGTGPGVETKESEDETEQAEKHLLCKANIETNTISILHDLSPSNIYYSGFHQNKFFIGDSKEGKRTSYDLRTQEKIQDFMTPKLSSIYPELQEYKSPYISYHSEHDLFSYSYEKKNQKVQILYDPIKEEVILFEKDEKEAIFIAGYNSSTSNYYLYKRLRTTELPSFPNHEDYDLESEEEIEKFSQDTDSVMVLWDKINLDPNSYSFEIHKTPNYQRLVEIPKVSREINTYGAVKVYNDKYALIDRYREMELYDLEAKKTVWLLDTDF